MDRAPRRIVVRDGQEPEPVKVATYKIHAKCTNCDWAGEVDIPKGVPVKMGDLLEALAECTHCGCTTLVRVAQPLERTFSDDIDRQLHETLERMARETMPRAYEPIVPLVAPIPSWPTYPAQYPITWSNTTTSSTVPSPALTNYTL